MSNANINFLGIDSGNDKKKYNTQSLLPWLDIVHHYSYGAYDLNGYLTLKDGTLEFLEDFEDDEYIYMPNRTLPYVVPSEAEIRQLLRETNGLDAIGQPWAAELLQEVEQYIRAFLEMPSEVDYFILSLWVFHTYLIEQCNSSPFMFFHAPKESGKSRAGEVLQELAFRGNKITSVSSANVFRLNELYRFCMIIDEVTLTGYGANRDLNDLLKSRYKRGTKVARINDFSGGEKGIKHYDLFGPTVICTTEPVDEILESRCLVFRMQKNRNPDVERKIDAEWARTLRAKLTLFRAKYFSDGLPDCDPITRRRLGELTLPLARVVELVVPDRKKALKSFIDGVIHYRQSVEANTVEAEIIEILSGKVNGQPIRIATKDVAKDMDKGLSLYAENINPSRIGRILRQLGFEPYRKSSERGFVIDPDRLSDLRKQYLGE